MNALLRRVLVILWTISLSLSGNTEETRQLKISVDNVTPEANDYMCASVSLPDDEQYIVKFQPEVTDKVHHLLLFSCEGPYSSESHWDCKSMGGICSGQTDQVVYAWANHAEGLDLPKGVGYRVGAAVKVKSLVMQLHYGNLAKKGLSDTSSVILTVTKKRPPNIAGVYLLVGIDAIPARSKGFSVEGSCTYNDYKPITPFAYRVHAHAHSTRITGYYQKKGDNKWLTLGSRSPHDPQAFYPIQTQVTVHKGDVLGARCQYVTSAEEHDIHMGADTSNEMCNFYIMFYTANDVIGVAENTCYMNGRNPPPVPLPAVDELVDTPPSPPSSSNDGSLLTMTPPTLELASDWFLNGLEGDATKQFLSVGLGQVSGVAVDGNGDVYILHRGSRVWDLSSFDLHNVFQNKEAGPIPEPVLLHVTSTGVVLHKMGANMFYLPHGVTVDNEGNIWITDVGLHQVFKFAPNNLTEPLLTLGEAFQPGDDHTHFCKPSAVAVATDGDSFFVADGYCNHRVMQFSKSGEVLQVMDQPVRSTPGGVASSLYVPHSLTLLDGGRKLMVADRENGRLVTMETARLSHVVSVIENFSVLGHRLFAVAAPAMPPGATTPYVYVVNQEERFSKRATSGFTVDLKSGSIVQHWAPKVGFSQPHDVAVSGDGQTVYVAEIGPNRIWKFSSHKSSSPVEQARNRSVGFDASYFANTTSQNKKEPLADVNSDDSVEHGDATVTIDTNSNVTDAGDNKSSVTDPSDSNSNVTDAGDNKSSVTDPGDSNSNVTDNEQPDTVTVQDETNMPGPNWDKNLHDDVLPSPELVTPNVTVKNTTAQKSNDDCPSLVPPCNNKTKSPSTPGESGFQTSAPSNASDDILCPLSMGTLECIKAMALQSLPALLLGVFFTIAIALMIAVAICLTCRNRGRCCSSCRGRRDLAKTAKRNMHSLLGPSHQGFVKVKTFDSDSDGEDVIFQQF